MTPIEHLEQAEWKHPDSYGGFSPTGDYVVLSRNRDSSLLEQVNWDVAVETLGAEAMDHGSYSSIPTDRPNAYHWRAGHWAVGWVEYLMIRVDAPDELKTKAGEMLCALADYPVLNEDRWSAAEFDAVCEYWEQCSVKERVEYLQEAEMSIFAARRGELPQCDDTGALYERLSSGL